MKIMGVGALKSFLFLIVVVFVIVFLITKSAAYSIIGAVVFVAVIGVLLRRLKIV